jgi:hypothetical protein
MMDLSKVNIWIDAILVDNKSKLSVASQTKLELLKNEVNKSVPAETTKEPIEYVDATPDEGYPLRILKAYRENCDRKWSDNLSGVEPQNPLIKMLNDQCDRRAEFLDSAIKFLEDAQ